MSKVTKTTIILIGIGLASKMLGFIREMVLASSYGASSYSDAYLVALTIPTIIFAAIGGAIGTSYIPLFCEIRENDDKYKSIKFTNNLINIVIIMSLMIIILGMIFTKQFVLLFAVGFKGQTLDLAVKFTRILFIGIIFIGLNYILTSYLQVNGNFNVPALNGFPYNIIIISSIILSAKFNIYILIYGTLLAMISQFLFQIPFAWKKGYKYRAYINIQDENIKKMMYLVAPVFIGVSVNQLNVLVDRTLASTLVEGSISALNFANRLNGFVMGLFVSSIATVIYPMLSNLSAKNNIETFKRSVVKSVNAIALLVIPISIGAMALSTPIVKLLFERGSFDARATQMTSIALFYFSIGMIGFGLREVLSRVFYSLQDTKTPMINGAIAMGLNIALNLVLVRYMAHAGLALGTSIAGLVTTALLFYSLRKKIGSFGGIKITIVMSKVSISSIIMGILVKVSYNYVHSILFGGFVYDAISLALAVAIGAIVYIGLIMLFRIEEVNIFIDMIKAKLKRRIA